MSATRDRSRSPEAPGARGELALPAPRTPTEWGDPAGGQGGDKGAGKGKAAAAGSSAAVGGGSGCGGGGGRWRPGRREREARRLVAELAAAEARIADLEQVLAMLAEAAEVERQERATQTE